jgi:hypothetical protein
MEYQFRKIHPTRYLYSSNLGKKQQSETSTIFAKKTDYYTMKQYLIATLICGTLLICTHSRHIETYVSATIPVIDERLSLSPLTSEAHIEQLPDWPNDPAEQKVLLRTFDEIWNRLKAEFRRCQKYGLYTIVEDTDNPTIRISVTLTSTEMEGDTLKMPIRLQAERLSDDQRFIYQVPASAFVSTEKRNSNPYYYYGQLLSEYRRSFPYKVLVSFFYRHKLE